MIINILNQKQKHDLKELNAALSAAQAEYKMAVPIREDRYFKKRYEALADLVKVSQGPLTKNGLSVRFEESIGPDGAKVITCILAHASGQETRSCSRVLPVKGDPHSLMSEIEFLKRMLYAGITGVVADDDDNASSAMVYYVEKTEPTPMNDGGEKIPEIRSNEKTPISHEQLEHLNRILKDYEEIVKRIKKAYNINYLADLPKSEYYNVLEVIEKQKQALYKKTA